MFIKSANYTGSHVRLDDCPTDKLPEYAFIGRSNVGKSSLINMLVNKKGLAKTSQKPGKTQTINFFLINEEWYIVDLPGYGYAKTSKSNRAQWGKMIKYYLSRRESLYCIMVLLDARLPPQKIDLEFVNWLGEIGVPFVLVYTKADKTSQRELSKNRKAFEKALLENWEQLPPIYVTSAQDKTGKEALLGFIESVNASAK